MAAAAHAAPRLIRRVSSDIAGRAAVTAGLLVRLSRPRMRMVPGLAGAACISIGIGELAGHVFGRGIAPWLTVLTAGVFSLWFGSEVNRPPAPPRNDDSATSY